MLADMISKYDGTSCGPAGGLTAMENPIFVSAEVFYEDKEWVQRWSKV
jgi:hypothetical protein